MKDENVKPSTTSRGKSDFQLFVLLMAYGLWCSAWALVLWFDTRLGWAFALLKLSQLAYKAFEISKGDKR